MKDFLQAEGNTKKEVILGRKADWLLQSHFLQGTAGVYQADCLTVQIRRFPTDRFQIPFLAQPKLQLNLSMVMRGLAQVTPSGASVFVVTAPTCHPSRNEGAATQLNLPSHNSFKERSHLQSQEDEPSCSSHYFCAHIRLPKRTRRENPIYQNLGLTRWVSLIQVCLIRTFFLSLLHLICVTGAPGPTILLLVKM